VKAAVWRSWDFVAMRKILVVASSALGCRLRCPRALALQATHFPEPSVAVALHWMMIMVLHDVKI